MGQGKSSLNNTQLYNPSEYDVHAKMSDSRYGSMTPLVNKATQKEFAAIYKTVQDEKEFLVIASETQFRQQLNHPNLIKLVNYNTTKQDELCSSFHTLGLLYEYYNNNLQTEIAERQDINLPYKEGELWYLAETLLSVVQYLKQNNVAHSDIRPYNVAIDNEGNVKVGEVFSHQRSLSSFSQIINHQLEEIYLSPQQLQQLGNLQNPVTYDVDRAEIYSVGMTLLNAATLENVTDICYDLQNLVIKREAVTNLLEKVRVGYSIQLAGFIQNLLVEDDNQRPSTEDLLQYLSQPEIQLQNTKGLYTVEILTQVDPNLLEYNTEVDVPATPQEDKILRAPANPVSEPVQTEQVRSSQFIYDDEDLDARIKIALTNSRETIAKYGITSAYVPPKKYIPHSIRSLHNPNNNYSNTDYSNLLATNTQQNNHTLTTSPGKTSTVAAAISPLQVITSSPLKASNTAVNYAATAPVRASNTAITYTTTAPVRTSNTGITYTTTAPVRASITAPTNNAVTAVPVQPTSTTTTTTTTTVQQLATSVPAPAVQQTTTTATTVPVSATQYTGTTVPIKFQYSNTPLPVQAATTTTTFTTTNNNNTVVQETPLKDPKASQIQTRTFLNENTNAIETKNYTLPSTNQFLQNGQTTYQLNTVNQTGVAIPTTTLPSYQNGQVATLPIRQSQVIVSNPQPYQPNSNYTYTLASPDKDLKASRTQVTPLADNLLQSAVTNTFVNKFAGAQNVAPVINNNTQNYYTSYLQNQSQPISYTSYGQQQTALIK